MAGAQDAGSIFSEVRIRLDKLSGDIAQVNTKFDKMGKQIQDQNVKTAKSFDKTFDILKISGVAAIAAVTLAFKKAITTYAATEQALANVQAVTNATAEDFKLLEDAATNAGTTTRFTAEEAADALFYLASAGLSATESIAALDGVLELAGATGSDLGQSALAVTSTLSQFSLESSRAADVANVFAAANSNSQATLDKLQGALRQTGAVAGALNIPLEEVVGSLQLLFNAGFQGEAAGRALKSALADLANESSVASTKLAALGVSFNDVNPEAVGLTSAIGALEDAGLSTAEIIDTFGKVAGPQLVTLINQGEDALLQYTDAVTGTNEATRQYAVQNDTLAGSFDSLGSAAEGAGNAFVGSYSPFIREAVDLTADLLRVLAKVPGAQEDAAEKTGAFGIGLKSFLVALSGPVALLVKFNTNVLKTALNLSRLRRSGQDIGENIREQFTGIGEAAGYADEELEDFLKTAGNVEQGFADFGEAADIDELNSQVNLLNQSFGLSVDEIISIGIKSGQVTDEYRSQLEQLRENTVELRIQDDLLTQASLRSQARANLEASRAREQALAAEELAREQAIIVERETRLLDIKNRAISLDQLVRNGLLDERDSLEEKISLREEEINILREQAIANGELTQDIITGINTQQTSIEGYYERLEFLDEQAAQNELDNAESTKSELEAINAKSLQTRETQEKGFNDSLEKARDKEVEDTEDSLEEQEEIRKEHNQRMIQFAADLFGAIASFASAIADAEIAEIDRVRDADLASVDARTQATLESLGLLEETKAEKLQSEIDAALAASDTLLAKEKQDELDRLTILNDAEDQKRAIELEAAKESAQIKYKADLAAWALGGAQAVVLGANATLQALSSIPYPFNLAAAASTAILTGIQLGTIAAAKPQPPNLAAGGIILPKSGGTLANLAENGSPELALNAGSEGQELLGQFAQQIANKMGGTGGKPIVINNNTFLDGKLVAKNSATYYNNGQVELER